MPHPQNFVCLYFCDRRGLKLMAAAFLKFIPDSDIHIWRLEPDRRELLLPREVTVASSSDNRGSSVIIAVLCATASIGNLQAVEATCQTARGSKPRGRRDALVVLIYGLSPIGAVPRGVRSWRRTLPRVKPELCKVEGHTIQCKARMQGRVRDRYLCSTSQKGNQEDIMLGGQAFSSTRRPS